MNASFNLIDQKWLPCVTGGGTEAPGGLLTTLVRAHEFKELRDASPLVTVALHRMILAVLHRVFGPRSPADWGRLWGQGRGRFDAGKLEAYLRSPEVFTRFDLFDTKFPFYQTAALPLGEIDKKNAGRGKFVKPVWQLAHELAYSDSMNLFAHYKEGDWQTRPAAEAARWLVAFQAFALGGLITTEEGMKKQDGSADAGQLVKSAVVLARGDNLFQTLMLNLVQYSEEDEVPFRFKASEDKAAWERDAPVRPADRPFDGYLDLLTWQSRRVRLVPELGKTGELVGVSGVVAMKGWQLPGFDRSERETMVGFLKPDKVPAGQDPWPPLGFRPGKELWRDSHALFQSVAEKTQRPRVLAWINDLRGEHGQLDRGHVRIDVAGVCADRAKLFYWRHESLPVPLAYLAQPELVEQLRRAIGLAEQVASDALRMAARGAAVERLRGDSGADPDADRVSTLVNSFAPERLYWSRLELPYRELIVALAVLGANRAGLIERWFFDTLYGAARGAFAGTLGRVEGGRNYKAAAVGESLLRRLLKKIQRAEQIPDRAEKEGAA